MIKGAYILKWGFLGLKKIDNSNNNQEKNIDFNILSKTIIEDIKKIFEKSKYVIDIDYKGIKDYVFFEDNDVIQTIEPFEINIKIPKKEIKEWKNMFLKESVDLKTEFTVLYNGLFYIIYWKIDPNKFIHEGGPEVRNVLTEIINNSKNYESLIIPPTPFREELIFNFIIDSKIDDFLLDNISDENINCKIKDVSLLNDFFYSFYMDIHLDFLKFSEGLQLVNELKQIERVSRSLKYDSFLSINYFLYYAL